MHSVEEIRRAAAAWAWFPRGSERIEEQLLLIRYPAWLGAGVRASQVSSAWDAPSVVDYAIERSRAWGEQRLTFWTSEADRPDLEEELRRRGAAHEDTLTVFARAVPGDPIETPRAIAVETVETIEQLREVDVVNVAVWKQQPLDDAGFRDELNEVRDELARRTGARVLARIDGRPASTGGFTLVDGFVRLWGAATLPDFRGGGAYRAVLAERLRIGARLGATTALVKGRVSTSAPILARAGFESFGEERSYVLTLD